MRILIIIVSLIIVIINFFSFVTAGECVFMEVVYSGSGSGCSGSMMSDILDYNLPAPDEDACLAMCGCFGRANRYGCTFTY